MERILRYFMLCTALLFIGMGCKKDGSGSNDGAVIEFTPTHALGTFFSEPEYMGDLTNFYLRLANVAMEGNAEEPVFLGAGNMMAIDMYVKATSNVLPTGTYKFTPDSDAPSDFTFSDYTLYGEVGADGKVVEGKQVGFRSANLTVSQSGGEYTIELSGTTIKGKVLHVKYTAKIEFVKIESSDYDGFPPIDKNIEADYIDSRLTYYGQNKEDAGFFKLDLFDYKYNNALEGNSLVIRMFSEMMDGKAVLAPGIYTVAPEYGGRDIYKAGDIQPGYKDLDVYVNQGTTLTHTVPEESYKSYYGFVSEGTVIVEMTEDIYTISVDLKDENGYAITGMFEGALGDVIDKSYYSTLKKDYEVNLNRMPCEIEYYGQYFASIGVMADSWGIYIGTWEENTEAIQLELLAPRGTFANGIPSGTYPVTITYPNPSEGKDFTCIPGEIHNDTEMHYSWYMGAFQGGTSMQEAPFKSGQVIVNNNRGEYTFDIVVKDDAPKPNTISCSWMGTPTLLNKSTIKAAQSPKFSLRTVKDESAASQNRKQRTDLRKLR